MRVIGEMLEEVDHFRYLGSQIGRKGGVEVDVRVDQCAELVWACGENG